MLGFDATSRVICTPRRIRTNTPLQALATLNDSAYIDMAAHFADRMIKEAGSDTDPAIQITRGYEIMLYKKIHPDKLSALLRLYNRALEQFKASDSAARAFAGNNTGDSAGNNMYRKSALKMVANAMLNLDEIITKY